LSKDRRMQMNKHTEKAQKAQKCFSRERTPLEARGGGGNSDKSDLGGRLGKPLSERILRKGPGKLRKKKESS